MSVLCLSYNNCYHGSTFEGFLTLQGSLYDCMCTLARVCVSVRTRAHACMHLGGHVGVSCISLYNHCI